MRAAFAIALAVVIATYVAGAWAANDQSVDPDIARRTAEKAKLDYANAQPASGLTDKVDTKPSAGQMEATLLMAQSLAPIAEAIVDNVKTIAKTKPVVIVPGTGGVNLAHWELFDYRTRFLSDAFKNDRIDQKTLDEQYEALKKSEKTARIMVTGLPILALSAASKLVSYAMSDYEIGGITLTSDDQLLVSSIVGHNNGLTILLPSLLPKEGSSETVFSTISDLDKDSQSLQKVEIENTKRSDELNALAKKDTKRAPQLNQLAEDYEALTSTIKEHVAAYGALMAALASSDDKNLMPLTAVLQEQAVSAALSEDGYALVVHMYSAAGSYYTKKNLWTAFGGMPFYVSGGAVASYTLIARKSGFAVAGGVVPFACGYRKASKVATARLRVECSVNP